jgi:hypothetical protein
MIMQNDTRKVQGPAVRQVLPVTRGLKPGQRLMAWLTRPVRWQTTETYSLYCQAWDCWLMVPPGFLFDGASIPKPLHNLIRPEGFLFVPGLFHDYAYRFAQVRVAPTAAGPYKRKRLSRPQADRLFLGLGLQVTGLKIIVSLAWAALRAAGWIAWNRHRKRRKHKGAEM